MNERDIRTRLRNAVGESTHPHGLADRIQAQLRVPTRAERSRSHFALTAVATFLAVAIVATFVLTGQLHNLRQPHSGHPRVTASASRTTTPAASERICGDVAGTATAMPWPIYRDSQYNFAISYPPNFTFICEVSGSPNILTWYRAIDLKYPGGPPGMIEIAIYPRDAETLNAWVAKHSVNTTAQAAYWHSDPMNQTPVMVGDRPGLAFEWRADPRIIHDVALFLGTDYVFTISWLSGDAGYGATLKQYHQRMLESFSG